MLRKKLLAYIHYIQNKMQLAWFIGNPCNLTGITNTLINNYKILGNSEQKIEGFDYDNYTPVEYLQSSGEQYIDTSYKPNQDTKIECKFNQSNSNGSCIFGGRNGIGVDAYAVWSRLTSGGTQFDFGSESKIVTGITLDTDHIIIKDKEKNYLDGVQQTSNTSLSSLTINYNLTLFGMNTTGTIDWFVTAKMHYCKLWNGTTLVANFIPCYRNSDSKPGMYDTVTSTFFTNANTSASTDFTVGSELPTTEVPVEINSVGDKTAQLVNMNDTVASNLSSLLSITIPTRCRANVYAAASIGTIISFHETANALAIPCSKDKTFSFNHFGTITSIRRTFAEFSNTGARLTSNTSWSVGTTYTTTSDDCAFLIIEWSLDTVDNSQMVVVEGSTIPTTYIPYGYKVPIQVSSQDIPDEYQQVEYLSYPSIETSSKYNISLMKFSDCDKIEYTFRSESISSNDMLLGYGYSTSGWLGFGSTGQVEPRLYVHPSYISLTLTPSDASVTLKGSGIKQTWIFEYDNTTFTSNYPFNLGGYSSAYATQAKEVYEIKCYLDNTVVADYIPCYRISDNKTGMYDITNNEFHASSGTNEFTLGPNAGTSTTTNIYLDEPLRSIGTSHGLPSGYTELEYIQSSGAQYIDTEISLSNKKIGVELDFQLISTRSGDILIGGTAEDGTSNYRFGLWNSTTIQWRTKINNLAYYSGTYDTNRHIVKLNTTEGTLLDSTVIDSNQYTLISTASLRLLQETIGQYSSPSSKTYSCKVYDEATLVRNFIPAKRNSDNEIGMYDLVTNTFFTNQGTGTFTAGPQIYQDYIEYSTQKLHKQTAEIASYNGETITTPYISSTGSLTTGAQVVYGITETEETIALPQLSVPLGSSTVTTNTDVQPDSTSGIQVQGYV